MAALGSKDLNYWITKRDFAKLDLEAMLGVTPTSDSQADSHYRLRQAEAVDALQKAVAAYETLVAIGDVLSKLEERARGKHGAAPA